MGRSRSRSRSRGRRHSRSRSPSSGSSTDEDGFRIHVGDLGIDCSRKEIERTFEKFGPLIEVWLARNPPCFAFIVYRHKEDAEEAIQEMNGKVMCGNRVRVAYALPRTRGRRLRSFDPNLRCYSCGERGHFSRDCSDVWRNKSYAGYRARSRSRSRERHHQSKSHDHRRRSRSRSRGKRRSRSRSRSRDRKRSRSRDRREKRRRSDSGRDKDRDADDRGANGDRARPLVPDYDDGQDK